MAIKNTDSYSAMQKVSVEQALRESKEKFRKLYNHANYAIYLSELTADEKLGSFIEVNDVACSMLNYNRVELLKMTLRDLVDTDLRVTLMNDVKKVIMKDRYLFETIFVSRSGVKFPVEISSHVFSLNSTKVLLAIVRDDTERKLAEETLRQSEERYFQLMELSLDTIVVHSSIGKILYANRAAAELLGVGNPEALLNRQALDFMHPEYSEIVKQRLKLILEDGQVVPFVEEKFIKADGSVVDVQVAGTPFIYQGQPAIRVVARDITEKKRAEEEFIKATKLESIGILAGGIAHDFNNILTIILGNLSIAKIHASTEGKVHEKLEEIEKAAQQAIDLTRQLLTFSKGGLPVKETVSIKELIRDVTTFMLSGSNVLCDFSFEDNLFPVEIDKAQISQVFNNLLINAIQAMPEGGTIRITAENISIGFEGCESVLPLQAGEYVKITFKDEGTGISNENLHRIFDPYFTTKEKGSGLGLATSYSIISKHDGYLTADSQEGAGAVFYIYLPALPEKKPLEKPSKRKLAAGRGKVLFMDDEEMIRKVAGEMLSLLYYEADFAKDGTEAVKLYSKSQIAGCPYSAVIMDLTVPGGMGGKEAIKSILQIDPNAKVIVSSGYSNDPVMAEYLNYGFAGFVTKPYEIGELGEVLLKVIDTGA